ncbi:MAG: FAD:protein FMN transferase [Saprospiraceae bacterium]
MIIKYLYQFVLFSILILGTLFSACRNETSKEVEQEATTTISYQKVAGQTMGTTYNVTYADSLQRNFKNNFDQLLVALNKEVNTYDSTSVISQFNQAAAGEFDVSRAEDLVANFVMARSVYERTQAAFDPTVAPLVNYWGFGYTPKRKVTAVDSSKIAKMMQSVGLDKITLNEDKTTLTKSVADVKLDLGAIAKGYGVDVLGLFLEKNNVQNYYVEIGGEVRVRGKNPKGSLWRIGINVPKEGAAINEFQTIIELDNQGLATSGNYRQFYEVDGNKYSHTISPFTGFPERNRLLSASVFAPDCTTADAYATAFMVMGIDKALALANELEEVSAYFIVGKEDGTLQVIESE